MNGRTIKKRLMKGRLRTFWGKRAFVTVRLPATLVPPEPPKSGPPGAHEKGSGWEELAGGTWVRETTQPDGSVLHEVWDIGHIYGGGEDWWEGITRTQTVPPGGSLNTEAWVTEDLPDEEIEKHVAYEEWRAKWLIGMEGSTGQPVLDAFHLAANAAKTTYPEIGNGFIYITYSVKWFYPWTKHRFCADLHRAFDVARKAGVPARLL